MAESSYSCSVTQGFNFEKDSQEILGHINYLKIGDTEIKADLNVTNPEDIAKTVKVVGVASGIYWNGGYADPIQFSCQVATENKNLLSTLVHKSMANTEVLLTFTIYDYDPKEKKFYKCFHTNDEKLKCLVEKSGGELAMTIDTDQSMEIVSPKNYTFSLGAMPQDEEMAIHVAVSVDGKFAKKFGVAVTA
ncbi:MAG: hypothetical protein PVI73_17830 [Syntrophobacterales bacterium]